MARVIVCDVPRTSFGRLPPAGVRGDISFFTLRHSAASISSEPSTYPAYCACVYNTPGQILLVVDAADAFCERGGEDARASLSTFINELCNTDVKLKILVTSDEGILERTDQYPSNSREEVSYPTRGNNSCSASWRKDRFGDARYTLYGRGMTLV